jgi:hypothetical protein
MMADYFTFRGYNFIEFRENVTFDGIGHTVGVLNKEEDDYLFTETIEITGPAIIILFKDYNSPEARGYVRSCAIARAKARIESCDYEADGKYTQRITSHTLKEKKPEPREDFIQLLILKTLHNIRKNNPSGYKSDYFEVSGFCDLYQINTDQLIYFISLLEEKNYVGSLDADSGKVFITTEGIEFLKTEGNTTTVDGNPDEHKEWDIFISHASEDKPSVVEPLANELKYVHGLRVWYDRWTLKVGDSLRQKIDEGLVSSQYGVVILSQDFFAKEWPQRELDGLFMRETINGGKKVILPVVHGMTYEQISKFSLLITGKLALNTRDGIHEIARQIAEVVLDKDIARSDANIKSDYLELSIQYLKLMDLSDGNEHRYELVVKAKLNGTPMLKQFQLRFLWPDRIKTEKIDDFRRGKPVSTGGQVYKELILEYDSGIYPGQEIEIVGPNCSYQIQYVFNNDTLDYVDSYNAVLKYTVFKDKAMPCEGEIEFARLNEF